MDLIDAIDNIILDECIKNAKRGFSGYIFLKKSIEICNMCERSGLQKSVIQFAQMYLERIFQLPPPSSNQNHLSPILFLFFSSSNLKLYKNIRFDILALFSNGNNV